MDKALLQDLWNNLLQRCSVYTSLLVAFSGGVDSTLLARAAKEAVAGPVLAVFCRTALIGEREEEQAKNLALELNIPFYVKELDILAMPEVASNRRERCFVCKWMMFSGLRQLAAEEGLEQVAEGSNADDLLSNKRPGLLACQELNIAQPLAEAGLNKTQVRALLQNLGLPNYTQPARPCLATRFPYDTSLKPELLERVIKGESLLADLGCREFRLRVHGNICRIEAEPAERELIMSNLAYVDKALTALGWPFVTIDLGGLKSGCFDTP
ncbi:MAG: ATP-dependent sacrificial sulfur transferase LarE [Firmicutes bacterium]|nr:ATP-dependent sacrificial sulfur transferase LarE [Bacillota bacterium]